MLSNNRTRLVALILGLAVVVGSLAWWRYQASLYDFEFPRTHPADAPGTLDAIGQLTEGDDPLCTATLVADRWAITSAGCLWNPDTADWRSPGSLFVRLAGNGTRFKAESPVIAVSHGGLGQKAPKISRTDVLTGRSWNWPTTSRTGSNRCRWNG